MTNYESIAKCKGKILIESEEYNKIRVKLVNLFSQINKVKLSINILGSEHRRKRKR
jgi:hypothetical protein